MDQLSNWEMYYALSSRMPHAFAFLLRQDLGVLEPSRIPVVGDDVYALVSEYETRPPDLVKWEAHRAYFDVQFLYSGVERLGYANIESLMAETQYDAQRDFLLLAGQGSDLILTAGMFAILGPQDAHRPGMAVDEPSRVRKIVVKVRVDG